MENIKRFISEREELNKQTLDFAGKNIKRFFNLDMNCYKAGVLDKKIKEMLGLSSSMVLRCDDCISYHLLECHKAGVSNEEIEEVFSIALIVGGSIVIPHLRRAVKFWEEINIMSQKDKFKTKTELFSYIKISLKKVLSEEMGLTDRLQMICDILSQEVKYYNWVGFYLTKDDKQTLVLGPYVGDETEHKEIPFGKGICGQTAVTNQTFLVPDVSMQSNYLSCSLNTKAEIVVPVFNKNNEFVAELDIDSHEINPFNQEDKDFLEYICESLKSYF